MFGKGKLFCTKCGQQIKGKPKGTVATPYCEKCFYFLFESDKKFWELKQNTPTFESSKDPLDGWYGIIALGVMLALIAAGFVVGINVGKGSLTDVYDMCNTACSTAYDVTSTGWYFNSSCMCSNGVVVSMPPNNIIKIKVK